MKSLLTKISDLFHPQHKKTCEETKNWSLIGPIDVTQSGNFSRKTYQLMHCQDCDVVWLDPKPTEADLRAMYEDGEQFSDATYTDPERVKLVLEYMGGCITHRRLLPEKDGAVLEIGAGLSWMSRAAKLARTDVRTVAQDVTKEVAEHCTWVDHYYVGHMEEMPGDERFDLISLTHVIEHLLDPRAMMALLSKRLKNGGAIFITAPYRPIGWKAGDGIEAWQKYSYLHVPAHIGYLSERFYRNVCEDLPGLSLEYWDASHEEGQAYEVVLRRALH
jgi:2-polyprenyl-3-methyl-5-hydroxy-6-metoxy-1,4-benzoquinol methylase